MSWGSDKGAGMRTAPKDSQYFKGGTALDVRAARQVRVCTKSMATIGFVRSANAVVVVLDTKSGVATIPTASIEAVFPIKDGAKT